MGVSYDVSNYCVQWYCYDSESVVTLPNNDLAQPKEVWVERVVDTDGLKDGDLYDGRTIGFKREGDTVAVVGKFPEYYIGVAKWSTRHRTYVLPDGLAGGRTEHPLPLRRKKKDTSA